MEPSRQADVEAHLAVCAACARFDEAYDRGLGELRSLPAIQPSFDFLPRLQHRLYHLEQDRFRFSRSDTSGTSVGLVLLLILLIGAAAWLPLVRSSAPPVQLPPIVAVAPPDPDPLPILFRPGPLLPPASSRSLVRSASNAVFFRYTPLGSNTVRPPSELPAPR